MWSLLLALASLGGTGYWLYENQNWLRDHPGVRPHLESGCELFGCILPPRAGAPLLHVHQLRLNQGPEGSTLIDAVLENRTGYRQRYPTLRLTIKNAQGAPVMRQTFLASDYLPTHFNETGWMPSHQPIRIHLRPGAGMLRTARITEGAAYQIEVP